MNPEIPDLPESNQLVGGALGWMTVGVFTCLQVAAEAQWPLLQLIFTALSPPVQLFWENPLLHTINREHVCAPCTHSCSRAAGMLAGQGLIQDTANVWCPMRKQKGFSSRSQPSVFCIKEGWQLRELMCRGWWRRSSSAPLSSVSPTAIGYRLPKRLLSTGRQKFLLTQVPRSQPLCCWAALLWSAANLF